MKRTLFSFWLVCGIALALSVLRPETTSASKLLTLVALLGLSTVPLKLAAPHRRTLFLVLAGFALVLTTPLLPARAVDAAALREAYLTELRSTRPRPTCGAAKTTAASTAAGSCGGALSTPPPRKR